MKMYDLVCSSPGKHFVVSICDSCGLVKEQNHDCFSAMQAALTSYREEIETLTEYLLQVPDLIRGTSVSLSPALQGWLNEQLIECSKCDDCDEADLLKIEGKWEILCEYCKNIGE